MSNQSNIAFWAKLGQNEYPVGYHPVFCHLVDVAVVARRWWDSAHSSRTRRRVATAVGLEEAEARDWIAFLVGAHDIGKVCPGFQFHGKTDMLRAMLPGFSLPDGTATPHATVSVPILYRWLNGRGWNDTLARRAAYAVGGHHGLFPNRMPDDDATLGNERWRTAQTEILTDLAARLNVSANVPTGGADDDQAFLMILAGLTAVADWLGSNQDDFPVAGVRFRNDALTLDEYFLEADGKAAHALKKLNWSEDDRDVLQAVQPPFKELFKNDPRPLQAAAVAVAAELTEPALVLIEAPMGEGKTEAALLIADAWERRGGRGAYFALPTMATSNGLFGRVEEFLTRNRPGRLLNLHLTHGQAALSEKYQVLQDAARHVYDSDSTIGKDDAGSVIADAWFAADKKQALLAEYGVGTIDQALLAVLQTKHFFVRLFGLAGKTVILDEVHAYDAYMSTLMCRLLRWLAALGCPVVLLSATLPTGRRMDLLKAYAGVKDLPTNGATYPRASVITATNSKFAVTHFDSASSTDKPIALRRINGTALPADLREALRDGGCACVIRNTVGLAQTTFQELRLAFGDEIEVKLFHARFPFWRRNELEKWALEAFGTKGPRPTKCVLVATQVVEQSLDLDFDLMVSDIAPIDLLLQRSGRLHRHERGLRPAGMQTPALWLIDPAKGADGLPDLGGYSKIYSRAILLRTLHSLNGKDQIAVPSEIDGLVQAVYAEGVPAGLSAAWAADLARAEAEWNEETERLQAKAKDVIIGYNTIGDLTSVTKAVGGTASGTTAFGYDALGRNDSVTQSNGSGVTVGSYTYTRDLADRLTGSTFVTGGVTSSVTSSHSFSYYDDNQLKVADGVLSKYDDGGNLKGTYNAATGAQLSSLSYGTANRLQNDGVYTYTYDDAGQMTGKSKAGESWTYGYDSNGQMTSASNGTDAVAYTFDAFGNRLSRVQSGGTSKMERFAYDGSDAFLDMDGSNAVTVRRQYGPGVDNLLSRQSGGSVEWYGTDAQGSVRQVFDNTGKQTSWADYEAHGALVGGGTLTDRYGFTGRELDGLTSQQYNRARVVDGQSWTSEDPMGFAAGDANLRRYVGNNPASKTDASGLEAENQSHSIVVDNSSSSPPASQPGWWRRQARRAGGLLDELKSVANYVASNPLTAFAEFNKGLANGALAVASGAGKAVVEIGQIGRDLGNTAIAGGVQAVQAVGLTNRNYLYDTHSGLFGGYDQAVRRNDGTSGDVWFSAVGNVASAGTLGLGQAFATAVDTGDWEGFAEAAGGNAVGVFGPLGAARAFRGVRGGAPGRAARGPSAAPETGFVENPTGGFEPVGRVEVPLPDSMAPGGAARAPGSVGRGASGSSTLELSPSRVSGDLRPNTGTGRPSSSSGTISGSGAQKSIGRSTFPKDPHKLFPENYAGMTKSVRPDGKIIYEVEAGGKRYSVEFHPEHGGAEHFAGDHYHVRKQADVAVPPKTTPNWFRVPNLCPNTPATPGGGTFAPGDPLPTLNTTPY